MIHYFGAASLYEQGILAQKQSPCEAGSIRLYLHMFNTWRSIEVVITSRTRNAVYPMVPWVRIPPSPPILKTVHLANLHDEPFFLVTYS